MYPSEPTLQASPTTLALYDALAPTLVDVRLSIDFDALERGLNVANYNPSMTASTMRERLQEVRDIGEVLAGVHTLSAREELAPLFTHGSALARYLRGVQRWCQGIAGACRQLASELRAGRADRWALRDRVASAGGCYEPELAFRTMEALVALRDSRPDLGPGLDELTTALEHLFSAADWLQESIRRYILER